MTGYNNVGSISSSWSNPPQARRRHTVPVVQVRANIDTYVSIEPPDVVYQFGQGRLIIELTDLRAIPSTKHTHSYDSGLTNVIISGSLQDQ